jgi:hypothetical protein
MANITLLHWNLETYGPSKFKNENNDHFIDYIAALIKNVDADIFSMVEVKNSISGSLTGSLVSKIASLEKLKSTPWRTISENSLKNSEAYIVMYRTDRKFSPYNLKTGTGIDVKPEVDFCKFDIKEKIITFPGRMTTSGGRRPFYVAFKTTDTNKIFTVISYHAMFGYNTVFGIRHLPNAREITLLIDESKKQKVSVDGCLISGDFNIDYNDYNSEYKGLLNLPSKNATNEKTSLQNNPKFEKPEDYKKPLLYRESAYDNIFQKIPKEGEAREGKVIDLMVESAIIGKPQPPPPAVQPHIGNLSAAAGAFKMDYIKLKKVKEGVIQIPPVDMPSAWGFVREVISNHYPVSVTTTI